MAKGHSMRRLPLPEETVEKTQKKLPEGQKIVSASVRTTNDLDKLMEQLNIPQFDVDEFLSEILPEECKDLEDTVEGDNPDGDDFREEDDDLEDDYNEYDEMRPDEPFDTEERDNRYSQKYIATISFKETPPKIEFSNVPQYDTDNNLIKEALYERYELIYKMAYFIAETQGSYFKTGDEKDIKNLNQQEIVRFLKNKRKEHVSRLLDTLYFKIEKIGTVPARFFIKRYGHKTGLTQNEKLEYAREFLESCGTTNLNQLQKAKKLVEFIEKEKGISIKLSNSKNEHYRYKQWKNLIHEVEKEKKGNNHV